MREIMEQAEVGREQFDLGSNVDYAFCTTRPRNDLLWPSLTHPSPVYQACMVPSMYASCHVAGLTPCGCRLVLASEIVPGSGLSGMGDMNYRINMKMVEAG